MTDDILDAVRDENETAISRLGSSKALFAATGGDLAAGEVLAAAADDAAAARTVFESWADEEPDDEAADAFAAAAEHTADQLETIQGEIDGSDPATGSGLADHLSDVEGTAARAGALLGWSVVSENTLGQVVGFFIGDADPQTASTVRDVRGETEAIQETALDLIERVEDRGAAKTAADDTVLAAYDDYVETLEGMGVNPKSVC